jgi:hypothetical protein
MTAATSKVDGSPDQFACDWKNASRAAAGHDGLKF